MIRAGIYSIEDVLSKRGLPQADFDGDMIYMRSGRYDTFALKGLKCVCCGIEGKFFAKEKSTQDDKRYHFNLYAINKDGREVLMTKDHVIPRSQGGKDHISNYQTMCTRCNSKKGSTDNSTFMRKIEIVV